MSESGAEDEAAASLIASVYCDVWEEFYVWDHKHSASVILSLRRDFSSDALLELDQDASDAAQIPNPRSFISGWVTDPKRWEYAKEKVWRADSSTGMVDFKSPILTAPSMDPSTLYESCTPTTCNIFVGDDSENMPFIPFPNESFDIDGYSTHYDAFAWQKQRSDPDTETILLESVRRLNNCHDVPLSYIERIFLPDEGLSKLTERDILQWLPFPVLPNELSAALPESSDMKTRFEGIATNFCPNLSCIEPFCALHEKTPSMGPPNRASLEEKVPTLMEPCGPDCFLYVDGSDNIYEKQTAIDETKRNTMATVLSVCPELTTCQLAIASYMSCQETYAIRKKHFMPTDSRSIDDNGSPAEPSGINTVIEKLDHFTPDYEPGLPCNHPEPCDSSTDCPCYHNKTHCEKGCRCVPKCVRRFRGCKCRILNKQKPQTCCSKNCPCLTAGRECDPELCISCRMEDGRCNNSQIQHGETKATMVKQGKYGMGLFVDEAVHRGELILEYTGELLFGTTVDSRDFFNIFRGRSYYFKLSESLTIDASKLGNESRFINHDVSKVNCSARYVLVNGVLRIGIFATKGIKRGSELHLDYGNEFFVT